MIIQIYEIQTPEEAEAMIGLGVDHIGSVILSESDWKIPLLYETVEVTRSADARSSMIPLFSDVDTISRALEHYQPDIVHFCETLSYNGNIDDRLDRLLDNQITIKQRFPETSIMRSIPIAPPGAASQVPTLELAAEFESVSDLFLTDTLLLDKTDSGEEQRQQPVSGFIGITGLTCDWSMARRLTETCSVPVVLAGGISPDNAAEGIRTVQPAGIDSCTGTNSTDPAGNPIRFQKDHQKVKRLVDQVHMMKREG